MMLRLRMVGPAHRRVIYSALGGMICFLVGVYYLCGDDESEHNDKEMSFRWVFDADCTRWEPTDSVLSRSKPQIKLDSRKFILPLLYNGPTNQLWGLKQAAYLAVILNRTLVMPVFRKHITDDSGPNLRIDANHRFQVEPLSNLMSIVSLEEYRRDCGNAVEAVFLANNLLKWAIPSLQLAEEELGLNFVQKTRRGGLRLSDPFLPGIKVFPPMSHDADRDSMKNHFQSDAKCVLYAFPFREIKLELKRNSWEAEYKSFSTKFSNHLHEVPDWIISHAIHLSTGTPKYVQEVAQKFLNSAFGEKLYVAIHWRYDMEDFHKFMCDKEDGIKNKNQAKMCEKVSKVTTEGLGKSVAKYIRYVEENSELSVSGIYIATPRTPSAMDFIDNLSATLTRSRTTVFTQYNLENFVRRSGLFDTCEFLEENFNEFLSLMEMEICSRSTIFLRSTYSSWSDSIVMNRVLWREQSAARKYDKTVINLFQDEAS